MQVDVDEDSSGTLSFQVGFSSGYGVFVQVSFGERNFNQSGEMARLRAEVERLRGEVERLRKFGNSLAGRASDE